MQIAADQEYAKLFKEVAFDPVFIIGDHRSGTTVLYQLLASTGAFNVVTAYDVVCYDQIVTNHVAGRSAQARQALGARFAGLGLATRGIDEVAVTPDLPEEYGFIIEDSGRPQLSRKTLAKFVEVCQKIRFIGRDRPLLLKSPWDVLAFAYVKEAFPRSKFIFVHRHPLGTMNSQLSATQSLFAQRNEYVAMLSPWYRDLFDRPTALRLTRAASSSRFGIGPALVARHVGKVASYYLQHVGALPPEDYTELRYEDLCTDPDATIQRILTFLGRHAEQPVAMRDSIRPRAARIRPEVLARYRRIQDQLEPFCRRLGYDLAAGVAATGNGPR
jgi:hypothetical protein